MKLILFTLLVLFAFCATNNINEVNKSGDSLKLDMQDEENVEKVYIVLFSKQDSDDKALTAANANQKEGITAKLNALDQLEDEQKANFATVEVNDDNANLMKKWHIKEGAANKRPVFLVAKGGQGKTFSGPLATVKSLDYFKSILPKSDSADEESGDEDTAGGDDAADEEAARRL